MNKRAVLFEALMLLGVLALVVGAAITFSSAKKNVEVGLSPPEELLSLYSAKEAFSFYSEQAAQLAAQQGFYNAAAAGVGRPGCSSTAGYIIWSKTCKPSNINQIFLSNFNSSFDSFLVSYPEALPEKSQIWPEKFKSSLAGSKLKLIGPEIELSIEEWKGYAPYLAAYTFDPSFTLDLTELGIDLDFEKIHGSTMASFAECSKTAKGDKTKLRDCMAGIKIDYWATEVELSGSYLLLRLITKRSYFFVEEGKTRFEPITLKVALKL